MTGLFQRDILKQIIPWLQEKELLVLLGARQVGKTSILRLLQNHLRGEPVFYFDLESTFDMAHTASPEGFVEYLKTQGMSPHQRAYCFLDEIQYHPDPSKFLKVLHDHHPNIKLIVSGSSSFAIRQKFKDALTGRKQVFQILPLSFPEYLCFKEHGASSIKASLNLQAILDDFTVARKYHTLTPEILPIWEEFVVYGGYPLPTLTVDTAKKEARLREIYNSYVQKDIKDLARIDNILQFNNLVNFLAVQISQLLKNDEVGKEVGLPISKLSNYLFLLENTFIISRLRPYHSNRQKELTKMPKLYFLDTGLRNTGLTDFRPLRLRPDSGALSENQCLLELLKQANSNDKLFFWRTWDKHEVDFICSRGRGNFLPIEVKYKTMTQPRVPSGLKNFMRLYDCPTGVVFTKDYLNMTKDGEKQVTFIPAWMA
ncbi:MAG: ATP-binding protein [bacterium]